MLTNENDINEIVQNSKNLWGDIKSNKLSTSSLKKTLNYIRKTLDYNKLINGDYSYETLTKICGNSIIRYPAIGSILDYHKVNHPESKRFIDNVQYNISKIQEIKAIVKSGNLPYINTTSTECLSLLYDTIKSNKLEILNSKQIFELIYNIYKPQETYVNLKILTLYTVYFISLKDKEKGISLQQIYDKHIEQTQETEADVFSRESLWKKELVLYLKQINSDRLDKTSAYPELTLKKILSKNILLLRHFEKYIEKHYKHIPMSIDSIQWFFNSCNIKTLETAIIYIANNNITPDNDRIKSKHTKHHCLDFIKTTIVFFRDRIPEYFLCKKDLHTLSTTKLLSKINDLREAPVEKIRRHFYKGEIDQIMENVKDDPKYTLIFTILKEVALRIGAVVTLQTKHFINHKGVYLKECRKLEKGKKYRTFPVSDNLKEKVKLYLEENKDIKNNLDSYLFPNKKGKYISTDSVRNKLIRITQELGIYGHHVHPHAFRHTIVNDLMAKGNKLENVSKYMGHSSISTTEQFYWTTELENIIPTMNIPWLKGSKSVRFAYPEGVDGKELDEEVEENENLSKDLLVSIIGVYHSLLDDKQKITVKERIPNIEEIFKNICEYSMTASLASGSGIEDSNSIKDYI